ncbi:dynein regulatory complex subunit 7 isoform X2 [Pezoporus occidentalis]|uniref:dynein regulatory complex subunit 7 isoform X2 n=1 Tax=Pezoporus occidentalis TaxID=407982 RepID=UPI002F915D6E
MDALEEKEEDEQRVEEKLGGLAVSDDLQDVETKVPVEQDCLPKHSVDMSQLPSSYKTNSPKEKQLLHIADNFLRQYIHLCPNRKPLFLHPVNECGVEKFVSTTVRPTLLPYTELYDWDGCARFVSDYLVMEPLECPITLPSSLYSPTTTLKHQRGNCFDFSVLLCSMLIGAGYDAYCVQGYATLETCTLDETQELCPLLRKPPETQVSKEEVKKKYRIKPLPDMQSKFELQQEAKKAAAIEASQKDKERDKKEAGKPKCEPLHGLRVHAWVLVLSGKREVPETFFINPFTGNRHNTTDKRFLGIESVWNHRNYWVNMQDCRHGCKDLIFDLGDAIRWEIMLSESNPLQLLPEEEEELFDSDTEREKRMSFDVPPSWVAPIRIPPRQFETRYCQGKKVTLYNKAKLKKWAPYLNGNGLVQRLTIYAGPDYTDVVEVREWFENREDILVRREVNKQTQLTTDYFSKGHSFCLKAHTYTLLEPKTGHTMEFYNEARVDGLQKRVETASEMTEYFMGRDDFLYLRHVDFGKQGDETQRIDMNSKPIRQIKECFHRNPEKPADEDVAECIFLITEEDIHLTYHLKDKYITASKKLFHKLPERASKEHEVFMTPETCITYQVLTILKIRQTEEADIKLSVSVYNRDRNEERRRHHEAMESTVKDEVLGQKKQDLDYLAPFLIQNGCRDKLNQKQALCVRDDCLTDFKHHLTYKINVIQARLEKAVEELQKRHLWFQENKNQLNTKEKDDYLSSCSESMFHINVLEQRLNREKQMAPQKYLALEDKLCMDPRIAEHLGYI